MEPPTANPSGATAASHGTPTMPPHPLTLDGSAVLHQVFRVRWPQWNALAGDRRAEIARQASVEFEAFESDPGGGSAVFSQLGHKGDLLMVHFRADFEELNRVERAISSLALSDFLDQTTSYVSVVELGLYDSTVKLYEELFAEGIRPDDPRWTERVKARIEEQAAAMEPRLRPTVPPHKYLCFYPMDKKRGESVNWYTLPITERRRMMREHGMIGRRFAGRVKQIISGSIGFDDWEWGVDLFADDPLVFKQLIYEMRFDEASALYALFGPFYIGIRLPGTQLAKWLDASGATSSES